MPGKYSLRHPQKLELSDVKRTEVAHRFDFYFSSLMASVIIVVVGFAFSLFFQLQILSIVVTDSANSLFSSPEARLLVAFVITSMASYTLWAIAKLEPISKEIGSIRSTDRDDGWPGEWWLLVLTITVVGLMVWGVGQFSQTAAQESLLQSYNHAIMRGEMLKFLTNSITYLTLAGSIGAVVSGVILCRWILFPWTRGTRAWLRRVAYYVSLRISGNESTELDRLPCPQCRSFQFVLLNTDQHHKFFCSFCGLPAPEREVGSMAEKES